MSTSGIHRRHFEGRHLVDSNFSTKNVISMLLLLSIQAVHANGLLLAFLILLIHIFLHQTEGEEDTGEIHLSLTGTYKMLLTILSKNNIRRCIVVLLTCKVSCLASVHGVVKIRMCVLRLLVVKIRSRYPAKKKEDRQLCYT